MTLSDHWGLQFPLIQAPMAGAQGSAMAIAVCQAGGLGSLPCALLSLEALQAELNAITTATDLPYNVNFFCHLPPPPHPSADAAATPVASAMPPAAITGTSTALTS